MALFFHRLCLASLLLLLCCSSDEPKAAPAAQSAEAEEEQCPEATLADTSRVAEWIELALQASKEQLFDSATACYSRAVGIYCALARQTGKSHFWRQYAATCLQAGTTFRDASAYKESLFWLKRGLAACEEPDPSAALTAELNFYLGRVLNREGDTPNSLTHLENALALFRQLPGDQRAGIAKCYNGLAITRQDNAQYEMARDLYYQALELRRDIFGENSSEVAAAYGNLGTVYDDLGDLQTAIEYYQKSLRIKESLSPPDLGGIATTCLNIGLAYNSLKNMDQALEYVGKSVAISRQFYGQTHAKVALAVYNLGLIYYTNEDYQTALKYFREAADIHHRLDNTDNRRLATVLSAIGSAHVKLGKHELGREYIRQALTIRRQRFGERNWEVAICLRNIGSSFLDQGEPDSALTYLDKSVGSFLNVPIDPTSVPRLSLHQVSDAIELMRTLRTQALALEKLAEHRPNGDAQIRQALAATQFAAALLDTLRTGYRFSKKSKLAWSKEGLQICDMGFRLAERLYRSTADPSFRNLAFYFSERARASVLAEALQESNARHFAGLTAEMRERERQLHLQLTQLETRLNSAYSTAGGNPRQLEELEAQFFNCKQQYQVFIRQLEKEVPQYYQLRYQPHLVEAEQLQAQLGGNIALVEYFLCETAVYIVAVNSSDMQICRLPRNSGFEATTENLQAALAAYKRRLFAKSARRLYQLLLEPVESIIADKERLVIIPDGQLLRIPFETLLTADPQSGTFAEMPYLMMQYRISYHYSASLFARGLNRQPSSAAKDFLGIAPVFSDASTGDFPAFPGEGSALFAGASRGGKVTPLPASAEEVTAIAAFFAPDSRRILLDELASEEMLKNGDLQHYRLVHIATHHLNNQKNPALSGMVFYPPDSAAVEDGILYASETYALQLNAALLVLSACASGAGQLHPGEGVLSFTRGFLYAGARNIVFSHWLAADRPTQKLMTAFYGGIAAGQDYSTALRNARLSLLQDPATAYPGYWANFVLLGSD